MEEYTSDQKNYALARKDLDLIPHGNFLSKGYEETERMSFFRINGVADFWNVDHEIEVSALTSDILCSCVRNRIPFAFAIIGDETGIHVYVGTLKILLNGLLSSYEALYPGSDITLLNDNPLRESPREFGGMFCGVPTDKMKPKGEGMGKNLQIESICRGMLGVRFTYLILASGLNSNQAVLAHEHLLDEMGATFLKINKTIAGGAQGNLTAQMQDYHSKNYLENLEILENSLKTGLSRGLWRVNGYYAADNGLESRKLGNLIKAAYSGGDSMPEPFRIIEYKYIKDVIENLYMMAEQVPNPEVHPLGCWQKEGFSQLITLYIYRFQTILNSNQLAVLCQLPLKEFPGYYIDKYVEFDVSMRNKILQNPFVMGDTCVAGKNQGNILNNKYAIDKNDLTRHALIIGITGGGKTNTTKSILNSLWNAECAKDKIPFLVIESAKREYWEMKNLQGFQDMLIFTLGDEGKKTSVKYRINPFETRKGISLQTHIDYLLATFNAAFEMFAPMPYVLEQSVYDIYADKGWDIVENENRYELTEYPTLTDLYNKIDVVVQRLGYDQEVQSNVKASLQARVHSLMIGGKGAMLNTPVSVPIEQILSRPAILELEDLGDDDTKSFVIGILLVQLYEYRKSYMSSGSKLLQHILMVEEAHRLLKVVPQSGEGGNSRAKSVEFFCNMLAEIRTYGQGILIADQIPTKIAVDSIKNTNLKIVHRTVAKEDREMMGHAMNMSDEQIEYLSSLKRGYAAVYAEGDNRPKCIKFPIVKSVYNKNRKEILEEVRKQINQVAGNYDKRVTRHIGCTFCERRCQYYNDTQHFFANKSIDLEKVLMVLRKYNYSPKSIDTFFKSKWFGSYVFQDFFEKICILGYMLGSDKGLSDGHMQVIIATYLKHHYNAKEVD